MSIERSRNWNPGGGNWLEVLPCLAAEAVAGSAGSYQPRANESWSRIYCTQETLTFSQKQSQTDNGLVYATSIRGFSPADDTTRAAEFLALTSRGRVLVRFRDNARLTRLIVASLTPKLRPSSVIDRFIRAPDT